MHLFTKLNYTSSKKLYFVEVFLRGQPLIETE